MQKNNLKTTHFFDFKDAAIQTFIAPWQGESIALKEKAIGLYEKVRDDWWYDPYYISLKPEHYQASNIVQERKGNCVTKSILLIAGLRALGIPARLHLGKVKNHIAVERLIEKFGSNELTPHGMVQAYLNDEWLKMSPAFNASLCAKLKVEPLEFDGENNSFLQAYNAEGNQFMEYLDDYGTFEDVPLEFMKEKLYEHYPKIFKREENQTEFNL